MKMTIALTSLAVMLCAGCSRNDASKLAALNQKIDWLIQSQATICSNQVIISNNQAALSARVEELPKVMGNYYTNETAAMYFYQSNQVSYISSRFIMQNLIDGTRNDLLFSMIKNLRSPQLDTPLDDAKLVEMEDDVTDMKNDLFEIQVDVSDIKTRLGIYY